MGNEQNNKREYWIRMTEHDGEYEISNLGNIRKYYWRRFYDKKTDRTRGRVVKTFDVKQNKTVYWRGRRNGEIINHTVASLVYKYFGDGRPDDNDRKVKVYHKDGNYRNNCIDNLFIARPTTDRVEGWQVDRYNQQAETAVKQIVNRAKRFYDKKLGIDPDEVEQIALIKCWENLSKLAPDEPFYNFAMRYCKHSYYSIRDNNMKFYGIKNC